MLRLDLSVLLSTKNRVISMGNIKFSANLIKESQYLIVSTVSICHNRYRSHKPFSVKVKQYTPISANLIKESPYPIVSTVSICHNRYRFHKPFSVKVKQYTPIRLMHTVTGKNDET